ncbi:MAG: FadR family transcriptional regulator [Thermoleophilia bacterium]|nr:FadR family transcriptional regulator [Thermoleophilia bacterium]
MQRDPALEAVFLPVRPASTFEETVERLGTAIRLGLLAPGSQLPPERELARELRISRTTLRQALTTLVQSGHLVSLRGRRGGTFVSEQPPLAERDDEPLDQRAWAVLDYRVAIECGAALLAAERIDKEQLPRLEELVEKMAAEGEDFEEYRRTDIRFHIAIAEAAHSPRLLAGMTEVQGQMTDLIALIAHPPEVLARSNEQHGRLVKALRKGDPSRAVKVMREHIEGTEHILAGLLPPQARMRSPLGSKSGSGLTSPPTQRPKISTSTVVPAAAKSGGR